MLALKQDREALLTSRLVFGLGEAASLRRFRRCRPGEIIPRAGTRIPDREQRWCATFVRLTFVEQVRGDKSRLVKDHDQAEPPQIPFWKAVWIAAQSIQQRGEINGARLTDCGEATSECPQRRTRRQRVKASEEPSNAQTTAARAPRRTPSQRIHAADPGWIGKPLKVVSALNQNVASTLRGTRDW